MFFAIFLEGINNCLIADFYFPKFLRRDRSGHQETFHHLPVFDDFHLRPGLLDYGPGVAADEGVAAEVLAAFDGLEEEGFAAAADFAVGGKRRLEVGQQAARYGDEVALLGEGAEFVECG
jgi:hypothetical protein